MVRGGGVAAVVVDAVDEPRELAPARGRVRGDQRGGVGVVGVRVEVVSGVELGVGEEVLGEGAPLVVQVAEEVDALTTLAGRRRYFFLGAGCISACPKTKLATSATQNFAKRQLICCRIGHISPYMPIFTQ